MNKSIVTRRRYRRDGMVGGGGIVILVPAVALLEPTPTLDIGGGGK
jgi:hypothetical protein